MRRLDAMAEQLDLSEEQAAKLKELLASFKSSDDPAALREAVASLLTPEQRQELKQRSGAMAIRSRQRRGRAAARTHRDRIARTPRRMAEQGLVAPLRFLTRSLDLSAEQQTRLEKMVYSRAAASRKLQLALRDTLRDILTPEQMDKIRGLMGTVRERMGAKSSRMDHKRRRAWYPRRGIERARRTARAERMGRRGDRRDRWSDVPVRLSAEQREALGEVRREIHEAHRTFAEENPDATDADKRAFGVAQREKLVEAMNSVLTAEQQLLMMRRTDRIGRRPSLLGLSEDQEARVKEALATHRRAAEEWAGVNPNPTPEARMEHARVQREALRSALAEILTPEQMEKLDRGADRRDRARPWRGQRMR